MIFFVALLAMSFTTLTASAKTAELKKVKSEKVIKKVEVKISKSKKAFFDVRLIESKCGTWAMETQAPFSNEFLELLANNACDQGWTSFYFYGQVQ